MPTLDEIRERVKSGKIKAAKPEPFSERNSDTRTWNTSSGSTRARPRPPTGEMSPAELEALYAKGSQATNSANSHIHGLRSVYEAGSRGTRS